MVPIQKAAPDFSAEAALPGGTVGEVKLRDYRGKYVLLFFYPLDFTFVCPTELIAFSDRIGEFRSRGAEVLGVSVDSVNAHLAWLNQPRNQGGIQGLSFPLISDQDKSIARSYGVLLDRPEVALRALFLIDREGVVRSMVVNDLPLGRSVDEALRLLEALKHVEAHGEVCPVDWRPGAKGMKATPEGLKEYAGSVY